MAHVPSSRQLAFIPRTGHQRQSWLNQHWVRSGCATNLFVWILTTICLFCQPSFADAPRVQIYDDVEKGLEIGAHFGFAYDTNTPVSKLEGGLVTGIEVGYDLTWVFRLKAGFCNHVFAAQSENLAGDTINTDYDARMIWGGASFSPLATERFYMNVQAGVGYLFTNPKYVDEIPVAGSNDIAILVGGGIEYYTTLRHFSFGLEANATIFPTRGGVFLTIYPIVRYTFGIGEVRVIKPPKDRDNDGVPDDKDKCPDTWGVEEEKGCPEPDTDSDGLIDRKDHCPQESGPKDNNGCPPKQDQDKDGLEDSLDRCPNKPGTAENDGCPEKDTDDDGIPDRIDLCPDKPGVSKYDGCPSKSDIKIKVKKKAIELREKIYFETDKAVIKSRSYGILNQVAATLKQYPEIQKMEIQGHTDSRGSKQYNQNLSQRRAQAVVDYLISKKIDSNRLEAKGYGEEQPIASNKSNAGRAKNRRVEMIIVNRD